MPTNLIVRTIPSGVLVSQGAQIVASNGATIRVCGVNWRGMNTRYGFPNGLDQVNYQTTMNRMLALGFNCIRIILNDRSVLNNDPVVGVNAALNPDLINLNYLGLLDKLISYAEIIKLKVILCSYNNEGGPASQPNGLWYDIGGASNGTDGAGNQGTIGSSDFSTVWTTLALRYKNNDTILGYDIRHEPNVSACTWGDGNPFTDLSLMYQTVGNLIQTIDSNPLIICEGPISSTSFDGTTSAYEGDLTGLKTSFITLKVPNKIVYSVHEYPYEVTGGNINLYEGMAFINRLNSVWGWLITENLAPVLVGEMGDQCLTDDSQDWGDLFIPYINGANTSGIQYTMPNSQGVSWCWSSWEVSRNGGTQPDFGILTDWSSETARFEQFNFYNQLTFRLGFPITTISATNITTTVLALNTTPLSTPVISQDANTRDPTLQPFSSNSFWNLGIGSTVAWSAASDPDTAQLQTASGSINAGQFGQPFYVGTATDPLITVTCTDVIFSIPPQQIRIPYGATPASGGDAHMAFFDQTNPTRMWSYYHCSFNNGVDISGGITAELGGVQNLCGDGIDKGSALGRYNFAIGTIRDWEIQLGIISHMLRCTLSVDLLQSPGTSWTSNIPWPNLQEDPGGPISYKGKIIFGSSIGIPKAININKYNLSIGGLILAKALQIYGAIIRGSNAGVNQIVFYGEPISEGNNTLNKMRLDLSKIIPLLRIIRNQSQARSNGGGQYPPLLPHILSNICPL